MRIDPRLLASLFLVAFVALLTWACDVDEQRRDRSEPPAMEVIE